MSEKIKVNLKIEEREFHLSDILSVVTGRFISLGENMRGIYDVLEYLTGVSLCIHQLPRAAKSATPYLFDQLPFLAEIDFRDLTEENWREWVLDKVEKYGETFKLKPLPEWAYEKKNPVQEAIEMIKEGE